MTQSELKRWRKYTSFSSNGCWTWTGTLFWNGYGCLKIWLGDKYQHVGVHRLAYEHFIGPIPADREIDHLCRNRACCNPAHLEAVSRRENQLRGEGFPAKNAAKTHCLYGHEFTPENTYIRKNGRGCRKCDLEAKKRRHHGVLANT